MLGNLTGWHLIVVLAIVLLLFGAPKLPGLARSLGQSMRIFRSEVKTMKDENASDAGLEDDNAELEPAPPKPAARKTTVAASKSTPAGKPKP
ncbi:MAG: Sec-independent protein translocase subunit TatA [Salinibacterium sp.]|nr:Sec-independent protein translocase subunit TatA [Salinibacterium sp.]